MKKLRLELDELNVVSFVTDRADGTGTVRGLDSDATVAGDTCGYQQTEVASCPCQTNYHCVYPTISCGPTETYGEMSCFCLYPPTDIHICGCGPDTGGAMC